MECKVLSLVGRLFSINHNIYIGTKYILHYVSSVSSSIKAKKLLIFLVLAKARNKNGVNFFVLKTTQFRVNII